MYIHIYIIIYILCIYTYNVYIYNVYIYIDIYVCEFMCIRKVQKAIVLGVMVTNLYINLYIINGTPTLQFILSHLSEGFTQGLGETQELFGFANVLYERYRASYNTH